MAKAHTKPQNSLLIALNHACLALLKMELVTDEDWELYFDLRRMMANTEPTCQQDAKILTDVGYELLDFAGTEGNLPIKPDFVERGGAALLSVRHYEHMTRKAA